jgi:hypothetical protein
MNGIFHSFPSQVKQQTIIETKEFDVSGSYRIPEGTLFLYVFAVSGGGGGSAGGRTASLNIARGGNGGGAGTIFHDLLFAPSIGGPGTVLEITIPAGGSGSAGVTLDTTNSSVGTAGGNLEIKIAGQPGYLIKLNGGLGANGSASSTAVNNQVGIVFKHRTTRTFASGVGGAATPQDIGTQVHIECGGAGGGGIDTGNNASAGANIWFSDRFGFNSMLMNPTLGVRRSRSAISLVGLTGGAINSNAASQQFHIFDRFSPGYGGVGGGSSTTQTGGTGGYGWRGSGGGGGGASRNGFISGRGGDGGNGYCVIMAIK